MSENNIRINDPYTNKARKHNLVARSYYKLEEIDKKFGLFTPSTRTVVDIWCAPGSRLQYVQIKMQELQSPPHAHIWFDILPVKVQLNGVDTYLQDITERDRVDQILQSHDVWTHIDCIVSDMAPNTVWMKDIDALRSVWLVEKTLWMYEQYSVWSAAIKIFMGPGMDELVRTLQDMFGVKRIQRFKPKSSRKASKELFIVIKPQ